MTIAGVMVHEITHNRGFPHDSDAYYANSVAEQAESCIADWRPNASVDRGYALYWNGARVGNEASWNFYSAKSNCQWNKTTHPNKKVECFFDGRRIGYELFHDGVRIGFEPAIPKWSANSPLKNAPVASHVPQRAWLRSANSEYTRYSVVHAPCQARR